MRSALHAATVVREGLIELSFLPFKIFGVEAACKVRRQNLPRQIEMNFYQHNLDESRSEQLGRCLDLTIFSAIFSFKVNSMIYLTVHLSRQEFQT